MDVSTQVAVITLLLSFGTIIAGSVIWIRKLNQDLQDKLDDELRQVKDIVTKAEISWERRLSQVDGGLRVTIKDVELFVRDNFVGNDVFTRMIDLAAANNENQFRAIAEQLNRLNDKLDSIQSAQLTQMKMVSQR